MSQTSPRIEAIFVARQGGEAMERVEEVRALAGRGLEADRYLLRTGYWSGVDECQVTLIEAEGLDEIEASSGVRVANGDTAATSLRAASGCRSSWGGASGSERRCSNTTGPGRRVATSSR